jgi:hypothetical protein
VHCHAPCLASGEAWCQQFYAYTNPVPVTRGFSFYMPSAGTAQITFNGTMVCDSSSGSRMLFDLITQIVTAANSTPYDSAPGGLRHTATLEGVGSSTIPPSVTFNLASTRVISYTSAGNKPIFFKVRKVRMDVVGSSCRIYNASFSATVVP